MTKKNILGTKENLELFNENGVRVYKYYNSGVLSSEIIYNSNGQQLTCKRSNGFISKSTYDLKGNELTYKDSYGIGYKITYDSKGKELTYKRLTKEKRTLIECTLEEFYQEFKEQ